MRGCGVCRVGQWMCCAVHRYVIVYRREHPPVGISYENYQYPSAAGFSTAVHPTPAGRRHTGTAVAVEALAQPLNEGELVKVGTVSM